MTAKSASCVWVPEETKRRLETTVLEESLRLGRRLTYGEVLEEALDALRASTGRSQHRQNKETLK